MTGEFVAEDGDAIDCTTCLEMFLNLFRSSSVVDLWL